MLLVIIKVKENASTPKSTGKYPPMIDPTVIPRKIKNLEFIILYRI